MRDAQRPALEIGHPAPQRHEAHPAPLLFVLFGAPLAWIVQLLFGFASTSYVCDSAEAAAIPLWLGPMLILLNLAGLTVAVTTLMVALRLHGSTGHEHHDRSGSVMDAGEGRTRFLAAWGIFISVVFLVATLANTLSLFLVPLCRT